MTRAHAGLLVAVLCVFGGCPEQRPEPIENIKVGLLVPKTGGLAGNGTFWENAARLAAEQINSSGGLYDGRAIELLVEDSGSDPGTSNTSVQSLLENGAVAIVGPAASSSVAGTLDTVAAAEVPQLSCCATSPTLTENQADREGWFFRTAPNDRYQGRALAYLATRGYAGPHPDFAGEGNGVDIDACPEMIILFQMDAYGSALAAGLESEYTGQLLYDRDAGGQPVPLNRPGGGQATARVIANVGFTPGFAIGKQQNDPVVIDTANAIIDPIIDDFGRGGPDEHDFEWNPRVCVAVVGFPDDGSAVLTAMDQAFAQIEIDEQATTPGFVLSRNYLAPDGLNDPAFITRAGSLSAQVIGTVPTHASNNAYDKFRNAYRARFNAEPGGFTSQMFDAMMLTGLAITSAKSTEGADIRDALFDVSKEGTVFEGKFFGEMAEALLRGDPIDYVGPSGQLDFDDAGDVIGDYALWRVVSGNNGLELREVDFLPADEFNL